MTRYRIIREIGRGGLATVYEARRELFLGEEQAVALKVLHPERLDDPECQHLFSSEAVTTLRLTGEHPNLVTTFDATVLDDGRPALVMELVDGVSLATFASTRGGIVPFDVLRRVARDALAALAFLHGRGFVHRDVSAANILIGRDGVVKLADFGLIKALDAPPCDVFRGTAAIAHPDQLQALAQSPTWDLWSLGATLYEMVTKSPPYGDGEPEEVCARMMSGAAAPLLPDYTPDDLRNVIDGLLRREPLFSSAEEALRALSPSADRLVVATLDRVMPTPEEVTGARSRHTKPTRPRRRGIILALVIASLLALAGAGTWWRWSAGTPKPPAEAVQAQTAPRTDTALPMAPQPVPSTSSNPPPELSPEPAPSRATRRKTRARAHESLGTNDTRRNGLRERSYD